MIETDTELTQADYGTCILAITKCNLIMNAIKAGLPLNLNKDTFKFPDMTFDEEHKLCMKLANNSEIAWLKETMGK